jgi:hypothetical protein
VSVSTGILAEASRRQKRGAPAALGACTELLNAASGSLQGGRPGCCQEAGLAQARRRNPTKRLTHTRGHGTLTGKKRTSRR